MSWSCDIRHIHQYNDRKKLVGRFPVYKSSKAYDKILHCDPLPPGPETIFFCTPARRPPRSIPGHLAVRTTSGCDVPSKFDGRESGRTFAEKAATFAGG
jgi:hypothetical protein